MKQFEFLIEVYDVLYFICNANSKLIITSRKDIAKHMDNINDMLVEVGGINTIYGF